jgi:sulfate permease, SulP family
MKWYRSLQRSISQTPGGLLSYNKLDFAPLRKTAANYSRYKLGCDLRAGVNVALLAFPQGMAYAMIAGLPVSYGIYGATVATIVGSIFAGSRFIVHGPSNATSVMLLSVFAALGVTQEEKLALLPLLLLMVGVFLALGAYLRVGNLIQYISRSVIVGYVTAAAILIISNQSRKVLGFDFEETATTFFDVAILTVRNLDQTQWSSALIGGLSLGVYLVLRKTVRFLPNVAMTLLVMSVATHFLVAAGLPPVVLLDSVAPGDWSLTIPSVNFSDVQLLLSAALAMALLCGLEGISIGKAMAARSGERLSVNQEMFSIGAANIACSCLSGMSSSGSLTRSVLNWASNSRTPLAGIITGTICLIGVFTVGPVIGYIPQTTLAVLIIVIGVSLINREQIRIVLRATRSDAWTFFVTLAAGLLFPLDLAIYLGAATSITFFMHKVSAPEMVEYKFDEEGRLTELAANQKRPDPEISIVHVEGDLFFGASDLFLEQMRRICEEESLRVVVLKMRNARHLDATSVMTLQDLIRYMRDMNRLLLVSEARKDVIRIFKKSGLLETIGRENIFPDVSQNPTLSTARALKRATKIIGDRRAKVSVYYDKKKEEERKVKSEKEKVKR